MTLFRRLTATVATVCLLATTLPLPAQASLVGTDEVVAATSSVHERVRDLLARQEVRDALAARGVDAAEVDARVAALTADEARLLAQRIDQLPAGGSVIGVLFAVFVILLVTDILGLTKVFPFTRPIR
jgi:uncharacterized small protein (DUF1192 family)